MVEEETVKRAARIMGGAPALAITLSRNPARFDAVLSGDFYRSLPEADALTHDLEVRLEDARAFEEALDISRRWANEHKFQIGVQFLDEILDGDSAGVIARGQRLLRARGPRRGVPTECPGSPVSRIRTGSPCF